MIAHSLERKHSRLRTNSGEADQPNLVDATLQINRWPTDDLSSGTGVPSLPIADSELCARIDEKAEGDPDYWSTPKRDLRESVHALFQYPAMMVPVVQRRLIEAVTEVQPGIRSVFDPFLGAGTSLVAAMYQGIGCYGQDISPLAVLISRVKTGPFFCDALRNHVEAAVRCAHEDNRNGIEIDYWNHEKWFRPEVTTELSRLRRAIRRVPVLYARRFMWVTLAETVRLTSNDRTSTYKLHARPAKEIAKRKVSPISTFETLAKRNLKDMESYRDNLRDAGVLNRGRYQERVVVVLGNTMEKATLLDNNRAGYDLIVTSPPYGDNLSTVPYGQHAFLPLHWIDLDDIDSNADASYLQTTQEIDRRSLGGRRGNDLDDQVKALGKKSTALRETFAKLEDKPKDRIERVAFFYRDVELSLVNILDVLKPNAYMICTVGNRRVGGVEIPTDEILGELLAQHDVVEVTRIQRRIHQKRMPTRNGIAQTMREEKILIFRRACGGCHE